MDRSGRGVRVAIVDSGVDPHHPWLDGARVSHFGVERQGEGFAIKPVEPGDQSGHGTACAGIIHRMAPEADLVSVRAFGPDGKCSRDGLLAALRFCVRERFGVVNLSLGIDFPRGAPLRPNDYKSIVELYEVADAAHTAHVVLVASGPNAASYRTYPGKFKSLIGVGRGAFTDPEALKSEITLDYEILAPGNDVLGPALPVGERHWTGTSFAAPHVSAHVARVRAARPNLSVDAVKTALHEIAAAWEKMTSEKSGGTADHVAL
ncbi:MAG: S8 family serine peptidase [Polyangiaceae bacterium]|nr:S8 family serine peptidase [Polyangiaceae bacterium]